MAYEDYRKQMEERIYTAADSMEAIVNAGTKEDRKEVVNRLGSMHRTLQQRFIGEVVIPLVRDMAGRVKDHNYDARNEMACKVCQAMLNGLAEKFPYIATGECNLPLV